jgi:hypothetical protein
MQQAFGLLPAYLGVRSFQLQQRSSCQFQAGQSVCTISRLSREPFQVLTRKGWMIHLRESICEQEDFAPPGIGEAWLQMLPGPLALFGLPAGC